MNYYCLDPHSHEALREADGSPQVATAAPLAIAPSVDPASLPDGTPRYLVPAHGVVNPPPPAPSDASEGPRQAAVAHHIALDAEGYPRAHWTLVPDHRGEQWFTTDGQRVQIGTLGDPSLDGLFTVDPQRGRRRRTNPDPAAPTRRRLWPFGRRHRGTAGQSDAEAST